MRYRCTTKYQEGKAWSTSWYTFGRVVKDTIKSNKYLGGWRWARAAVTDQTQSGKHKADLEGKERQGRKAWESEIAEQVRGCSPQP